MRGKEGQKEQSVFWLVF